MATTRRPLDQLKQLTPEQVGALKENQGRLSGIQEGQDYYTVANQVNPGRAPRFDLGEGAIYDSKGDVVQSRNYSNWEKLGIGAGLALPAIAGAGMALGALGGAGAAPSAAGGSAPAAAASAPVAAPSGFLSSNIAMPTFGSAGAASATPAAAATGSKGMLGGFGSKLAKIFGGKGIDPTMLLMGGLSLLGGDDGNKLASYRSPGSHADPVQSLEETIRAIYRLGQGMQGMEPVRLRSSYVQPGPAPVSIPGLGVQIGGGLARDPALADPSLLEFGNRGVFKYDPFQSLAQQEMGLASTDTAQPRVNRRAPRSGE